MAGISTQGATIRVSDEVSPLVFNDIGCVTNFSGPSGSRQVIDTTCLTSTGREKNVGIPDFGQVQFDLVFDTTDTYQVQTWDDFKGGTRRYFRLIIPNSPEDWIQFLGYVLNFSITSQIDDVIRASVTIEIDGSTEESF